MLRHIHTSRWRWYILGTLILAAYPLVVSFTILSSSLGQLLVGTQELTEAKSLLITDPVQAEFHFQEAQTSLGESISLLQQAPWYTQLLTPLPPFRWQVRLIKGAHALAESGTITSSLLNNFPPLGKTSDPTTLLSQSSSAFSQWYSTHSSDINQLQIQLSDADSQFQDVPNWIVPGKSTELYALKNEVHILNQKLPETSDLITQIFSALGKNDSSPHTFLVLFQNNNELRMSGGFFGSFATITASSGTIRQYTFGKNIYSIDNPYTTAHPTQPPAQLATITSSWGFRDSNIGEPGFLRDYSPQIAQFYTNETAQPIEGIIYIDVSMLESILTITGPIELPNIGVVSADTISATLTKYVELDYYNDPANKQINQPKSVLNDLLPLILEKLRTTPNALEHLIPKLGSAVEAKDIQMWSNQVGLQATLEKFLPIDVPQSGNWLKIVQNNIGGMKSSRSVYQQVAITSHTNLFQNVVNYDVTITRSHEGTGAWPDGENINYSEVYLPAQAKITLLPENHGGASALTEAEQKSLGTYGKQWSTKTDSTPQWQRISFWSTTNVAEQTAYHLSYSLPNSDQFTQQFSYLKEAGSTHETLILDGASHDVIGNLLIQR